jgi:hypothetical protein
MVYPATLMAMNLSFLVLALLSYAISDLLDLFPSSANALTEPIQLGHRPQDRTAHLGDLDFQAEVATALRTGQGTRARHVRALRSYVVLGHPVILPALARTRGIGWVP